MNKVKSSLPSIGLKCESLKGKYRGETGYVCGYHVNDSPEFWVKLDNYDLEIRVFPHEVRFLEEKKLIAARYSIGSIIIAPGHAIGKVIDVRGRKKKEITIKWWNDRVNDYDVEDIERWGYQNLCEGDRVNILYHKEKYYSDYDWGIVSNISSKNIDVRMGDRFHIAVDIKDIFISSKNVCLHNLISAQESAQDFPSQAYNSELNLLDSPKLTTTATVSLQKDTQECVITETYKETSTNCEKSNHHSHQLILSQQAHLASPLASKESDSEQQTSEIASLQSSEQCNTLGPDTLQSKMLEDYSPVPISQDMEAGHTSTIFSVIYQDAGMMLNGKLSAAASLERPSLEKGYSWLESPGALSNNNGRPPGLTKQESELRSLKILKSTEVVNPEFLESAYSLPLGWTDPQDERSALELLKEMQQSAIAAPPSEMPLIGESQPLPLKESSTSTPSLKLKAITLHEPWTYLVGRYKWFETRDWPTNYRGKIAIHAAKKQDDTDYWCSELSDLLPPIEQLPFKSVVAIADLTDCIKMTEEFIGQQSETELRCGLWKPGRYAWKLENVQILDQLIPARGMPGLWDIDLPSTVISQNLKPSDIKLNLYICDASSNVGQVVEKYQTYFRVNWGGESKCYFWERDEYLIDELAIAPQDLVSKFLEEKQTQSLVTKSSTELKPGDKVKFTADIRFRDIDENSKFPASAIFAKKGDWAEVCSYVSNGRVAISKGGTGEPFTWYCKFLEPFLEENLEPLVPCPSCGLQHIYLSGGCGMCGLEPMECTPQIEQTQFKTGDRITYDGKTGTLGKRTAEFGKVGFYVRWDNGQPETRVTVENLINFQKSNSIPENFLEEKSETSQLLQQSKPSKQKGCLYQYLENKRLKDGTIASYPRVAGHRDPDNPTHWRWGYKWEEKIDSEWKGRSIGVPIGAIPMIKLMQKEGASLEEIIGFIKRSKNRKS